MLNLEIVCRYLSIALLLPISLSIFLSALNSPGFADRISQNVKLLQNPNLVRTLIIICK